MARRKYLKKKSQNTTPILLGFVCVMAVFILLALGLRVFLDTSASPVTIEAPPDPSTILAEPISPTPENTSFWQRLFHSEESAPSAPLPEPDPVISRARICFTGDILMHLPVINSGLQSDGRYQFDDSFQFIQPYVSRADYAVANLETTLCGTEGGYKYSGYPAFNCPDEIVDALKNAGFDLLLTANNHCYDTGEYGFLRTVRTIRAKGLDNLGTMEKADEPRYLVKDINGIKIGMVCFTYEGPPEEPKPGIIYMNRNPLSQTCASLINSFLPEQPESFYLDAKAILSKMKQDGAEATIMLIHWGQEYQTIPNGQQNVIAQQLCDMGYDVIVGGHPHVIQPIDLLTSRTDSAHRTICLYSTGNAISNQRIAEMDLKTGHTEDGVLFSVTFSKYEDGTVYPEDIELIPCWVDMESLNGSNKYFILPLSNENSEDWAALYHLSEDTLSQAFKSQERTFAITNAGINKITEYLNQQSEQRKDAFLVHSENAA